MDVKWYIFYGISFMGYLLWDIFYGIEYLGFEFYSIYFITANIFFMILISQDG